MTSDTARRIIHADTCDAQEEEQLQQFANLIENSAYFSRDARRMFLFRQNNVAEITEEMKGRFHKETGLYLRKKT